MATISLPIAASSESRSTTDVPAIDRRKPYKSCEWLEGGLAFNRRSLNACLIVHHGRGFPHLCDFNGGEVDMRKVLAARRRIIAANQAGGYPACRGCPHLVKRRWPQPRRPVRLIGIAQFAHCNIECSYCFLQTQAPASFAAGLDPYPVLPALRALARDGWLDRRPTVDWGGGEPTIYPEFDEALELFTRLGATTWIHTNGTRLPGPIRDGLPTKAIHVLCSVDAGTRQTWQRIKNKDLLAIVWRNLREYVDSGCRVVLKYIMTDENCDQSELTAFVRSAKAIGARELIVDVDYDHPQPTSAVVAGLRRLMRLGIENGFYTRFGSTGANFTPEIEIGHRLEDARVHRLRRITLRAANGLYWLRSRADLAWRRLRYR